MGRALFHSVRFTTVRTHMIVCVVHIDLITPADIDLHTLFRIDPRTQQRRKLDAVAFSIRGACSHLNEDRNGGSRIEGGGARII